MSGVACFAGDVAQGAVQRTRTGEDGAERQLATRVSSGRIAACEP